MRVQRIVLLIAAVVIPRLALAELRFSNDTFGKMDGTFDFCARVDSQSAAKYQERKKAMVKGLPENEVAEARSAKEYKDAYKWMSTELEKAPKDQAVAACKAYLEGK